MGGPSAAVRSSSPPDPDYSTGAPPRRQAVYERSMFPAGRRAAAVLASLALPAVFLAGPGCSEGGRSPRVLLVGVDGVDPAIVERLSASGRLPAFTRLRREGAFGVLASREPLLSP